MSLIDEPVLQDIWHDSLPEVLPSNVLPFLTKMEKLAVRNCSYVKTIFDVKCITEDRKMTTKGPALIPFPFSLKVLTLEQLPNLENVWNEDPHGILTIELLKQVYVDKCKCLISYKFVSSISSQRSCET